MKDKVALIILFNHRFDKNIEVLERIYAGRFSHIYHLVPFYDGVKSNVIPVYEHSHFFQGYIAQGFSTFYKEDYRHYIFVADDMILNPSINESNYQEHLRLDEKTSFIPELILFHTLKKFWLRTRQAFLYNTKLWGVEAEKELPSREDAAERFKKFGIEILPVPFSTLYAAPKFPASLKGIAPYLKHQILRLKYLRRKFKLPYPLVGAYSDILVVSSGSIKKFCHYSGAFAATRLFVEIAIPTALLLSAEKLVLEKDLKLQGKALWTEEELNELTPYNFNLKSLLEKFPENYLYLHPVKLSKWETSR